MPIYQASLHHLEKILQIKSLDHTPRLMVLLDTKNEDQLYANLIRINDLIKNTSRFISSISFADLNGDFLVSAEHARTSMLIETIIQSMKDKYNSQITIKNMVEKQPFGPYADFCRTPAQRYNLFGLSHSASETQDLATVPNSFNDNKNVLNVDSKTGTLIGAIRR